MEDVAYFEATVNRKYARDLLWTMARTEGITVYRAYPAYWANDMEVIVYGGAEEAKKLLETYIENNYVLCGHIEL